MGPRKQSYSYGPTRSRPYALSRRVACLLAAASLLPVLVLGPLGPGAIVIHDHHEEDLHAHKLYPESSGRAAAGNDHHHPAGPFVDDASGGFVLSLPDLPRLAMHGQSVGLQAKPTAPTGLLAGIMPQITASSLVYLSSGKWPVAAMRLHDTITSLLLGGHSLLI